MDAEGWPVTFDVVLTGVGAVSPWGGKDAFFRAFLPGSETKPAAVSAPPGGGATDAPGIESAKLRTVRYMDPAAKNAIAAIEEAMVDAGIAAGDVAQDPYGYGIVLAASRGPLATREKAYEQLRARQGKLLSGTLFSNVGYNIAAAMAAMAHGIKGPNLTVAARSNLSLQLFRRARQLLKLAGVHTVFAGFSESQAEPAFLWPWACAFCLERPERARQRRAGGAVALAEIEPAFPDQAPAMPDGRAVRLPRPIPRPLRPEVLAAAETVGVDHGDSTGLGPEYLPLLHAGRVKAMECGTEHDCIAFPVRTRSGPSLFAVARA
jgi:hypothetical protein